MSGQRCPRALSILLIIGGSILLFATAPIVHFIDSQTARSHRREADARLRVYERQFGSSAALGQGQRTVVSPGRDGYLLEIPRIGLRAVVRELEPEVFSGRNTPVLKRYGLGQVPYIVPLRNVSPGGEGTAAITGHRTTSGAPFRYLDRLRSGDVIFIRKGAVEQQWTVTGSTTVGPRAVEAIRSRTGSRKLALLACNPPFSARERLIVYAELIAKSSVPRIDPARASQAILTGGAHHMRGIASRMLGAMAILNMLALSMAIAVALAHPAPSPPSPGEAPNPAPGPERPPEGAEPKPGPAPAPPAEKPAEPPGVSPPPPPAPAPAPPPVAAEPQPAPPPPAAAEPQPAPPPASQPAPAPAPPPAQPPVVVTRPAPAPISPPAQPVVAPVAPPQPPAPSVAQAPRGPAAARPGAVISSAVPGGPAVRSQAAPIQLPFGGLSPALSLFISMARWVGAALVIVGIMLYTSACKRRGSSDGRAEA